MNHRVLSPIVGAICVGGVWSITAPLGVGPALLASLLVMVAMVYFGVVMTILIDRDLDRKYGRDR